MSDQRPPLAGDVASFIAAIRVDLGMSQVAFGAMTGRSAQSIHRYECGVRRPPAVFFHDLIEAVPDRGLRFNDIAATFGYRPIDSADPARYGSIHEFFTGVRVLNELVPSCCSGWSVGDLTEIQH